jgi:hypothetical protein
MVKLSFCMRRLPHLSREDFQKYWREEHPKAAGRGANALGIRRYIQVHALPEDVNRQLQSIRVGEDDFDGVADIWLDSLDAYHENWEGEAGKKAFQSFLDDEQNFVDWGRSVFFLADETVMIE